MIQVIGAMHWNEVLGLLWHSLLTEMFFGVIIQIMFWEQARIVEIGNYYRHWVRKSGCWH